MKIKLYNFPHTNPYFVLYKFNWNELQSCHEKGETSLKSEMNIEKIDQPKAIHLYYCSVRIISRKPWGCILSYGVRTSEDLLTCWVALFLSDTMYSISAQRFFISSIVIWVYILSTTNCFCNCLRPTFVTVFSYCLQMHLC